MEDHQGFSGLGLAPAVLAQVAERGYVTPTPIQQRAIPVATEGKDVIGIAQTGTGKTLAFGLPLLQRLSQGKGRALIVLPTRELAYQVEETLQKFAPKMGIVTAVFVGGASMKLQRDMLRRNPRVLVATPGRLIDHLEQRTVSLSEVSILVLDEADRMLDMGFAPQIKKILAHVPKERQTLLFSATMPKEIMEIATKHMKLPLHIEVAPAGTTAERVEQEMFVVRKEDKVKVLLDLLAEHRKSVLVFSRTKHGAKKLTRQLLDAGHSAAEIHANRSLAQRRQALEGFKKGTYRVLVATDIAARGIDVTGIELVVNFDLPDNPEDYVHRIGRTGRAGMVGKAVSLATPDQGSDIRAIERLIRVPIRRGKGEGQAAPMVEGSSPSRPQYRGGQQSRGPRPQQGGGGRPQSRQSQGGRQEGGRGQQRGGRPHRGPAPQQHRGGQTHTQGGARTTSYAPLGGGTVDHGGDDDLPRGHRAEKGDVLGLS